MEDSELQAIRQARMAQLRASGGGGGGSSGPSASSAAAGLGQARYGGAGGGGGMTDMDDDERREQMAQQEEMKREMLSTVLESEARERLSRIGLVKPGKARAITDMLIRMAQTGQIRSKVNEAQLIDLLDQVDRADQQRSGGGGGTGGAGGKITFTRKKTALADDSDDDFDL
ncbi:hypothetical protein OC845_004826 [Tilletia horrida]|nr:hypothetical protein OC845_004826 [Tilletia horrida]